MKIKIKFFEYMVLSIMLFAFVAAQVSGAALTYKFNTELPSNNAEIMVVMGDIDDDGTQELVFSAGDYIYAVNGKTGTIEWRAGDSYWKAVELADLNNDGTPEVLYAIEGPRLRAMNGDGTIRWTSDVVGGNSMGMFPIMPFDIDDDGYPEIYFATEDASPDPYSGNPAHYDGALNKFDHNGNLEATAWLHHPCWGGITLGDADFDGNFEVYVSDRREGYHNFPANGLQAFDAETLDTLWERPDLQHSSPMGILADVVGDADLEMIATPITLKGPVILNAITGETIADYQDLRLPTHATPTVYDIDYDGNKEIIYSTSYPKTRAPKNFVVFDLVTGEVDFEETFENYWVAWPPKVGDVTGDEKMEILVATGTQGFKSNFPLLIYDSDFNLIETVSTYYGKNAGQLMPARVYDTDSDGFNEVVVAGINGQLIVYDTKVRTPNPAPRTWLQFYSEHRAGAAEYVPPPGGSAPVTPVIRDISPVDDSEDVPTDVELSFEALDYQDDLLDIQIGINDGTGWNTIYTLNNRPSGTFSVTPSLEYDTLYSWRITVDDNDGHSTTKVFQFTTEDDDPGPGNDWKYRKDITIDHDEVDSDLDDFPFLVDIDDSQLDSSAQSDGDDILFRIGNTKLDHEIEEYDNGELVTWVRIPTLSSSVDTVISMYYGNSGATDQQNPQDVWDSDYISVYHMAENSGAVKDSTDNNNDGTAENGVNRNYAGAYNGACSFDGSDDRIELPRLFTSSQEFTFEGWVYTDSQQGYIISQRGSSRNGAFLQYYPPEGNFQMYVDSLSLRQSTAIGSWHYVVGTFNGNTARLYLDDNAAVIGSSSSVSWPSDITVIGDRFVSSREFDGTIDEIRVSDVARSTAYVHATFANQDSTSFYDVGPQIVN